MPHKNTITPLAMTTRRPPEAGRIRLGVKTDNAMKSIDTFRFTSPNRRIIEQLAALYGGTAKPWNDPKANPPKQFEVITTTNEIPVYLTPEGLSCWYELWSGGGCQRRCDGVSCEMPENQGQDYEMVSHPCICTAEGVMRCKPYTRLNVIIPSIEFYGVWRLETKGWNAQQELPGMFDMIVALDQQGRMVQALLGVDRRERMTPSGKRNFVVPRLSIVQTAAELATGQASVNALAAGGTSTVASPLLAINAAIDQKISDVARDLDSALWVENEEFIEAEIVTPELLDIEVRLGVDAGQFGLDKDRYIAAIKKQIRDRPDPNTDSLARMRQASERVRNGELTPLGFNPDGTIQWRRET